MMDTFSDTDFPPGFPRFYSAKYGKRVVLAIDGKLGPKILLVNEHQYGLYEAILAEDKSYINYISFFLDVNEPFKANGTLFHENQPIRAHRKTPDLSYEIYKSSAVGKKPIDFAIETGKLNIVRILVELGREHGIIDENGENPLHKVFSKCLKPSHYEKEDFLKLMKENFSETIEFFVNKGADINYKDEEGQNILNNFSRFCSNLGYVPQIFLDFFSVMAKYGADPFVTDDQGKTAFDWLSQLPKIEIVKTNILKNFSDTAKAKQAKIEVDKAERRYGSEFKKLVNLQHIKQKDSTEDDAIKCQKSIEDSQNILLEKKKILESYYKTIEKPSVANNVLFLFNISADQSKESMNNHFTQALQENNPFKISELTNRGFDVDEKINSEYSHLEKAILDGFFSKIQILLEHGAKIEKVTLPLPISHYIVSNTGETSKNIIACLKMLKDKGLKLNETVTNNDENIIDIHLASHGDVSQKELTEVKSFMNNNFVFKIWNNPENVIIGAKETDYFTSIWEKPDVCEKST